MKRETTQSYEVYNHRIVWGAARRNMELAASPEPEGKYFAIASMVLTFFALEGYLNWLGEMIYPDIWHKERSFFSNREYPGTLGKLKFLREKLGLPLLDESKQPLTTLVDLQKARHFLVHTKPERGTREITQNNQDFPPEYQGFLTRVATADMAATCIEDVNASASEIHAAALAQYSQEMPTAEPFCGLLSHSSTAISKIPSNHTQIKAQSHLNQT